ncbi:hypothetical protein SAMN05216548_10739 [Faunimonas pinastri]|uniref:ASCH domain-containing protein n=1 Tax=Faunimonas pinastri TaxID=1855383 RepID=A0A1H9IAS4_9HYPH|nr:hypothetical protein [Faunimonas pinastri]SEQ71642.1 hypothetical protein SAMN05216548_10739 [Faunimonas pinastri]
MADRQILFSAPMIRALLDGRKTQTRRVVGKRGGRSRPNIFDGTWADSYVLDPGNVSWREDSTPWKAGDRLQVREACAIDGNRVFYRARHEEASARGPRVDVRWRPSIHMPRWASRLTLIVTDVRVQRLQDISETDAIAEGLQPHEAPNGHVTYEVPGAVLGQTPERGFQALWSLINGDDAWAENPWVAAISFDVVKANIDSLPAEREAV